VGRGSSVLIQQADHRRIRLRYLPGRFGQTGQGEIEFQVASWNVMRKT
jgi:hypothetical protein